MSDQFDNNEIDQAIAQRLSRLKTMPVDTSRLDKMIRAQIPRSQPRWFLQRRFQAMAASFVVLVGVASVLLVTASSGPVLASAAQMAEVHRDIVAGRVPIMRVSSIAQANQMLSSQSPDSPGVPNMPESHVMACCMKSVHDKKMACVLFNDGGAPITLAVAHSSDMKSPAVPPSIRNGVSYRVQYVHGLNMVMTERNGKWLCLISELPADRLMDIAAQIQF